jgi:hypothetical protein
MYRIRALPHQHAWCPHVYPRPKPEEPQEDTKSRLQPKGILCKNITPQSHTYLRKQHQTSSSTINKTGQTLIKITSHTHNGNTQVRNNIEPDHHNKSTHPISFIIRQKLHMEGVTYRSSFAIFQRIELTCMRNIKICAAATTIFV